MICIIIQKALLVLRCCIVLFETISSSFENVRRAGPCCTSFPPSSGLCLHHRPHHKQDSTRPASIAQNLLWPSSPLLVFSLRSLYNAWNKTIATRTRLSASRCRRSTMGASSCSEARKGTPKKLENRLLKAKVSSWRIRQSASKAEATRSKQTNTCTKWLDLLI